MARVYLSFGSNLGDRWANLHEGLKLLPEYGISPVQISRVYETAPVGETPDPRPYLNLGVWAETELDPLSLLHALKTIERRLGRIETGGRWLPRTLDIDIILYDSLILETPELTIPHPRMRERAFVLLPLYEMTPELILPDGTPLRELVRQPHIVAQEIRLFSQERSGVAGELGKAQE